jgi:microcystin-dependent protein
MSFLRAQRRAINRNVYYDNRLTNFTNPPIRVGDLYVERNESIGGDLDICGNLTVGKDLNARSYYATGNYYLNNYVLIPAGTIIQSAAINEPAGWFDCNGRILLKIDYANLFDAIGYTYGGADSSFNIPDMRGRVGVGSGTGAALTARALGETSGEEGHILTVGELPSHSHSLTRRSNPDNGTFDTDDAHRAESSAATTDRADLGLFTTNATGSGLAHNNMQPYVVLRYLIKY